MKKIICLFSLLLAVAPAAEAVAVTGRVRVTGRSAQADAVTIVYAEPLDRALAQPGTYTISQRDKIFSPRVLPVSAGSTVQFPNDDLIFHNVFSLSRPGPFDLGLYRAGATKSRVFMAPSAYRIFCNIHPQMTAIVLVLPTPHFTEADTAGVYQLDLPAGRYRITVWSERSDPSSQEVTVGTGPVMAPELSLNESQFVELAHRNKFGLDYVNIAYDPVRDRKPR